MIGLRKRILITISIAAGFIIAIILLLLFSRGRGAEIPAAEESARGGIAEESTRPAAAGEPVRRVILPGKTAQQDPGELYARQLAKIFVERYSSYSNQNNNKHIEDALLMATDRMSDWLRAQALKQERVYAGQTTKVISSSVVSFDNQKAEVSIDARVASRGLGGSFVTYKSGKVELVKIGEEWKVDGLFWE